MIQFLSFCLLYLSYCKVTAWDTCKEECKPYQVCCSYETCCSRQNCCGDKCCSENESCIFIEKEGDDYESVCCNELNECGEECCESSQDEVCCNGKSCCENCCYEEYCCPDEYLCCGTNFENKRKLGVGGVDSRCCNSETETCCNDKCCPIESYCCNGECCPSQEFCADFIRHSRKEQKCLYPKNKNEKKEETEDSFEVTTLPIGNGYASTIVCNNKNSQVNSVMLVDFSYEGKQIWESIKLVEYISSLKKKRIDLIISSPKNEKSKSLIPSIFGNEKMRKRLGRIFVGGRIEKDFHHDKDLEDFLNLESVRKRARELRKGKECYSESCLPKKYRNLMQCGDGSVEIIMANQNTTKGYLNSNIVKISTGNNINSNSNSNSMTIFGRFQNEVNLEELMEREEENISSSSVLVLPNNGDELFDLREMYEIFTPKVLISSNDYGTSNNPKCTLIGKYLEIGSVENNAGVEPSNIFQCALGNSKTQFFDWYHKVYTTAPRKDEYYKINVKIGNDVKIKYSKMDPTNFIMESSIQATVNIEGVQEKVSVSIGEEEEL